MTPFVPYHYRQHTLRAADPEPAEGLLERAVSVLLWVVLVAMLAGLLALTGLNYRFIVYTDRIEVQRKRDWTLAGTVAWGGRRAPRAARPTDPPATVPGHGTSLPPLPAPEVVAPVVTGPTAFGPLSPDALPPLPPSPPIVPVRVPPASPAAPVASPVPTGIASTAAPTAAQAQGGAVVPPTSPPGESPAAVAGPAARPSLPSLVASPSGVPGTEDRTMAASAEDLEEEEPDGPAASPAGPSPTAGAVRDGTLDEDAIQRAIAGPPAECASVRDRVSAAILRYNRMHPTDPMARLDLFALISRGDLAELAGCPAGGALSLDGSQARVACGLHGR